MVSKKIESLTDLLRGENSLDSQKIKDCIALNNIDKEDVPLHIKKVILERIISNKTIPVLENIKKIIDLGVMPSNVQSDSIFRAASCHIKGWEGLYDLLIENNIIPENKSVDYTEKSFLEDLFNSHEYRKIRYLYEKGVNLPKNTLDNIFYRFIKELDVESFKLCIDVGLWENGREVFQFYEIDKKSLERRSSDLSEMISYLHIKNVLDENTKKQICLSLLFNSSPMYLTKEKFKELQPDLSYENLKLDFLPLYIKNNIYEELIKNDFEKLKLCESFNLKIKNISAFELLQYSLANKVSLEEIKKITEKAEKISPEKLLNLAKFAFSKNRKDEAFFFSTKTSHQKVHYHFYRSTVDLSQKKNIRGFLENMEKHFLKFMDEPDLVNSRGYYRKASPFLIAFCFELDEFNKYLDKGYVKKYENVLYTAIKKNLTGAGEERVSNEEFFDLFMKVNLSNEEKKKVINYISMKVKESGVELEEKGLMLISRIEKRLIEIEVNTELKQNNNQIKKRI